MKAYLSRRYHFAASHRLHTDHLTAEENAATYGKCNHPYGHGHNYTVQVTYSGAIDPLTGMIFNLGKLDSFARDRVLEQLDFHNLNTLPMFKASVPTSENLAVVLHELFSGFGGATLDRVHVEETLNNSFDFGKVQLRLRTTEGKCE